MHYFKTRVAFGAELALAIGLTAVFMGPARAAFEAVMSCAQTSPCLEWDNTSRGDAVKGVSTKGNAVHGQTKFDSTGKTVGKAGVFGEDLSTSGTLNAGVSGVSANGAGVLGTSSSFNAVEGLSTNSTGVYGQTGSASGFGAAGRNVATSHDNNGAGLLADGGPADDGLHAFAGGPNSVGLYAFSQSGSSLVLNQGPSDVAPDLYIRATGTSHDMIEVTDSSGNDVFAVSNEHAVFVGGAFTAEANNGTPGVFTAGSKSAAAAWMFGGTVNAGTPVLDIFDSNANELMKVTDRGDVAISGLLNTGGSCHIGCIVGHGSSKRVAEYAPLEAEPTIEDNGEATLVNGRADVPLDPKFANVIDTSSPYIVNIAPEGDSNGLYVADRNAGGFTVRESLGGRSSIGFAYRIVAKRYGVSAPRLPMTAVRRSNTPARDSRHHI